ncbi:PAAR domain-containing protein [Paraburkholderia bryophila]|uniref:Putative Zn-binding protein involved in type VI secretion n=1 Tax=Paraburkholderia bryophila TaxID=420952 RepID=A0A7Y9W241_9BURK|nr:PAAR domain-containing protein [Paraburkholderia bryophila]NYH12882.1 putative Zn-binding protein involved in type VI secretion [Paraburkholderia bryophila]
MRKAVVRHGDPTTTGGVVIALSSTLFDDGKHLALHGDEATCGNCKGQHKIFGTGQGMSEQGRNVVLDGDTVLCPCGKNKVIIGSNPRVFMTPTAGPSVTRKFGESATGNETIHDEQFTLVDLAGAPLPATYYTIRLATGEMKHGTTDSQGRTARYQTNGAQNVSLHLGHNRAA